jgi:SAM-dependent methyltransferase
MDVHARNKDIYRNPETVSHYISYARLEPSEQHIFDKYVQCGIDILDIGVEGGRTTPYLSGKAGRYLAVDYSEQMISACRERFPGLEFKVMDAADMSDIPGRTFDVVVFSFNGIGYLHPDAARQGCLREIHRILRPGGFFIFSLHNSRSLFERPRRAGRGLPGLVLGAIKSLVANARRASRRLTSPAFWAGSGYLWSEAHGGLTFYSSTPQKVFSDLQQAGFAELVACNEEFPRADRPYVTRWYHYVFQKCDIVDNRAEQAADRSC